VAPHDHPCLSRRRSLHIASLGGPSAGAAFGGSLRRTWWRPRRVVWQVRIVPALRNHGGQGSEASDRHDTHNHTLVVIQDTGSGGPGCDLDKNEG
jgi:hypothetical protein